MQIHRWQPIHHYRKPRNDKERAECTERMGKGGGPIKIGYVEPRKPRP